MRVALVTAPLSLEERYGVFSGAASTQPSFALVCLGAIVKQMGMDVRVIDTSAENMAVEEALKQITDYNPTVLGISATTAGIIAAADLAARVKGRNPDTIVILGGCHASALPLDTLQEFPSFDILVFGEGETTFAEILSHVHQHGTVPTDAKGTTVRANGQVILNAPRPLISDLNDLPLPAWELLVGFPTAYKPAPTRMKRSPCASVVLTRGCPNRCQFCDRSVFGNRVRAYSTDYAIRMVKELIGRFGVRELLIEDDTFTISESRVVDFCERIIAENIDITWSCLGRADRVNPHMLKWMKRAGCWHISYGIESGDPSILKAMGKGENLSQIQQAVSWTRAAKIRTKGFFIVGFPGETEDSLRQTEQLMLRLPLDDISIMQLTPFPGSAIFKDASDRGSFSRDWRKMNTLNTVFIPHGLSKEALEGARARMTKAFYFRPHIIARKAKDVFCNPRLLKSMYEAFQSTLEVIKGPA